MSPRTPTRGSIYRRGPALTFGLAVAALLALLLFPWFPGGERLEEGSAVSRALTSPREHSYISEVLTTQRRQEAAAAVEDVWVFDPSVRDRQLGELESELSDITDVRSDDSLSASARESAIRQATEGSLSERGAAAVASATDAEWEALAEQARSVLSRVLSSALDETGLSGARLRAAGLLSPLLTADQSLALTELLEPLIVPTLVVDTERTEVLRQEASAAQPPVRVTVARGEVVVPAGRVLTAADIEKLDELRLLGEEFSWRAAVAAVLVSSLAGAACTGFMLVAQPPALATVRRLALFMLLLGLPVAAAKFAFPLLLPDAGRFFLSYGLPLAAAPIAAAVLLDLLAAVLLTILVALVAAFAAAYMPVNGAEVGQLEVVRLVLTVVAGGFTGLLVAAHADRLQRYLVAGMASAAAVLVVLLVTWLIDPERQMSDLLWMAGAAMLGGLGSAIIAVGAFILLSRPFGIITRIELMELAQLHHPLLRRLQDEAPGTFQHSLLVGTMAERAADRVGADPLLVRVGAYYHDIGKLVAPTFFVENSGEENPHEGLDPLQSTRVIHQHVTHGLEIARRERLPAAIGQFIQQHHGTRLMTYFYRRAAEADPDIDPELFRYPGPKPQSRETALVMIADACEATARASTDRSPERIRGIVNGVIRERIEEGQFSECDISMRDLAIAGETFASSLIAVYHPRVEYPEPTPRERAERSVSPPDERSAELEDGVAPRAPSPLVEPITPRARALPERTPRHELTEDDT